jgi:hypothetical protein
MFVLHPRVGRAQSARGEWSAVDAALGRSGKAQPGDVQRYTFPRSDLHVMVGDVAVKPALALTSWVAFRRLANSGAMAMGDLVLSEAEVPAVIEKLEAGGVHETALHNHLQHESPRVMYLHVEGRGDPAALAAAIHAALITTGTPATAPTPAAGAPFALDTTALAHALQRSGTVNGGVYQVSVPRAQTIRMGGEDIPPAMGVATALNFQPSGNGKAVVTGDFVLTADEVDPVMQALRQQRIQVTALHSHMLMEEPRLLFLHFWADDDALRLAEALRGALARTQSRAAGL